MIESNLNLLTSTRFLAYIPLKNIDPNTDIKNFHLNLTSVTINPLSVHTNDVGIMGYNIPVPANVRSEDKTVTISYLMDSYFTQYKILLKWFNKIVTADGTGASTVGTNQIIKTSFFDGSYRLPFRILILSEFKKPVIEVTYENSWISGLGSIELDYQSDGNNVKSNFTLKYDNMIINDNPTII